MACGVILIRHTQDVPTLKIGDIIFKNVADLTKCEVNLCEFPPRSGIEQLYSHSGEECIYMLQGQLNLSLKDEDITLSKGDTLWFPSNILHKMNNDSNSAAYVLWSVSPATFSHPELTEDEADPFPVPPIENWRRPYILVKNGHILGETEINGVYVQALMIAPRITALTTKLLPGTSYGNPYTHEGIETCLVIEGRLEWQVGEKKIILNKGDFLTFPSTTMHTGYNNSLDSTVAFHFNFPGSFWMPARPQIYKPKMNIL